MNPFGNSTDPYPLFKEWYELAAAAEPVFPEAVTLATIGLDGRPAARVVLLRGYDATGLTFFTNSTSDKGQELATTPHASLLFYWRQPISRQIRITGRVQVAEPAVSDQYFAGRPRDSQIGAWASLQSSPMASRQLFEDRIAHYTQQFAGQAVPRPPHWHGYHLTPDRYEFWQERPARLHDRLLFTHDDTATWQQQLLYP
jgi:pyridoxamine 5'-phosphate oxidase